MDVLHNWTSNLQQLTHTNTGPCILGFFKHHAPNCKMFRSVSLVEYSLPSLTLHEHGMLPGSEQMCSSVTLKCISSNVSPCPLTHAFLFPWLIYSVILVPVARQLLNHFTLKVILCPPTTGQHYRQLMFSPKRGTGKLRIMFFSFLFCVCMCGKDGSPCKKIIACLLRTWGRIF